MTADSFVFYKSFAMAANKMDDDVRLSLYDAIVNYCLEGIVPELSGVADIAWNLIQPQLDANSRRRENGKKGAEYGVQGGRPPIKNPIGDIKENPIGVNDKTPNVNDNVNVNVNDNDNDTGSDEPVTADQTTSQKQALELSELLLTSHRKEFSDYLSGKDDNAIIDRWAVDIEKLIRIDKKAPENIRQVILWAKEPGCFWFSNIESGKKLREKYETLWSQMQTRRPVDKKSEASEAARDDGYKKADEIFKDFERAKKEAVKDVSLTDAFEEIIKNKGGYNAGKAEKTDTG
jgi:hypothetical protein